MLFKYKKNIINIKVVHMQFLAPKNAVLFIKFIYLFVLERMLFKKKIKKLLKQ